MFSLLALGAFLLLGVMVLGLIGGILKLVFFVLFLPLRLLGKLIALPFLAIGALFKLAFGVVLLPVLLVGGAIALVFVVLAGLVGLIIVPLMPLLIAGVVVWGLVKVFSRPAAIAPRA